MTDAPPTPNHPSTTSRHGAPVCATGERRLRRAGGGDAGAFARAPGGARIRGRRAQDPPAGRRARCRCLLAAAAVWHKPGHSIHDRLCRLLFLLGALRDAGAARLTAVLPYLAYAHKDQRSQPRDPVTHRYLAQLLEAVGVDGVVTLDVHNRAAFQNAFRRPVVHLEARSLFVAHFAARSADWVVVAPDGGAIGSSPRARGTDG